MKLKFMCTYWGSENLSAKSFLHRAVSQGYDGVEINFPEDEAFVQEFVSELNNIRNTIAPDFSFIAQQVLSLKDESVSDYTRRMINRLEYLTTLSPDAINSHTGKDYYDWRDNIDIIAKAEQVAISSGIPIWHEIHRGRFSFHLKTLLQYLAIFPQLKLVADLSHFCVVSESDLHDQQDLLTQIYPNIAHIHARVGFEQSPQVNNPFAPEWADHLARYQYWWREIIEHHTEANKSLFTITPECGPFPYMPQAPFTRDPMADQWQLNVQMKQYLQQNLDSE